MGCSDFQNKHYSKELGTCSVCSLHAGFKNNSRCGVEIVPMPKFKNSRFYAQIKEKIDDAKIANLREQFCKQGAAHLVVLL